MDLDLFMALDVLLGWVFTGLDFLLATLLLPVHLIEALFGIDLV